MKDVLILGKNKEREKISESITDTITLAKVAQVLGPIDFA